MIDFLALCLWAVALGGFFGGLYAVINAITRGDWD